MKKALFVLLTIAALAIASSAAVCGGGGLDAWFMVDPGCVVEITPYADYGTGRLGANTFNLPAKIVIDQLTGESKYEPARMTLFGGVHYDVTSGARGWFPRLRERSMSQAGLSAMLNSGSLSITKSWASVAPGPSTTPFRK